MIRYFYSLCFLIVGTCLPLLASGKVTGKSTPSTSPKTGSKGLHSSYSPQASAAAQAKEQSPNKSVVKHTSDLSRVATSTLAAKAKGSSPQISRTEQNQSRPDKEVPAPTAKKPLLVICPKGLPSRADLDPVPVRAAAKLGRLARVTAYWAGEGDYYTGRCISATGVHLHDGHCAVDPNIIPYGSVVVISGVGKFLAVDTGSAVISRTAAREGGHTSAERNAIVVDLFFEDADRGERFAAGDAKYVSISWWTPTATGTEAKAARDLFAEENWSKIQSKQL